MTLNKVLRKKLDKRHVVELLAENAHEYKELVIAHGIDDTFVKGLKNSEKTL